MNTSRDMALLSVRARASTAVLAQTSLLVRLPPRMTVSSAGPSSSRLSIVMPECAAPACTGTSMRSTAVLGMMDADELSIIPQSAAIGCLAERRDRRQSPWVGEAKQVCGSWLVNINRSFTYAAV